MKSLHYSLLLTNYWRQVFCLIWAGWRERSEQLAKCASVVWPDLWLVTIRIFLHIINHRAAFWLQRSFSSHLLSNTTSEPRWRQQELQIRIKSTQTSFLSWPRTKWHLELKSSHGKRGLSPTKCPGQGRSCVEAAKGRQEGFALEQTGLAVTSVDTKVRNKNTTGLWRLLWEIETPKFHGKSP